MNKTKINLQDIINLDITNDMQKQELLRLFSGQNGIELAHIKQESQGVTQLCIHYNPNIVTLNSVRALLQTQKFDLNANYQTIVFAIQDMSCNDCALALEYIFKNKKGVIGAIASYVGKNIRVEFTANQISAEEIAELIVKAGFSPQLELDQSTVKTISKLPVASKTGIGHQAHVKDSHTHHHEHDGHDHSHEEHKHEHKHGASCHDLTTEHSHGDGFWGKYKELLLSISTGVLWAIGLVLYYTDYSDIATYVWMAAYIPGGAITLKDTIRALMQRRFNIEGLMIFAAIGAGLLGQLSEGVLLLFLFGIGHALEHFALNKARRSIKALTDMSPKKALLKLANGETQEVLVENLELKQVVVVKSGQVIPCDGIVLSGYSSVNQAAITGESIPVDKAVNDNVFAGTMNGDGLLEIEVIKLAKDTTLSRMLRMITEADTQKSPTQMFAEKFERIFVPVVLVGVVLVAVIPVLFGWLSWSESILKAIIVLVSASPCALALATPVAVLVGISRAAREGVLIKGGMHLENLGKVIAIAVDKTGTLTQAKPEVKSIICIGDVKENELLNIAYGLERNSSHPLAHAIVEYCQNKNLIPSEINTVQNINGKGISGEINGKIVLIGSRKMFTDIPVAIESEIIKVEQNGCTIMLVKLGEKFLGVIGIADAIRENMALTLQQIKQSGIQKIIMLTGDNQIVANSIASELNLDGVRANLLPEDKVSAIRELNMEYKYTAMVGDGVNDAPAMANATVGIAMGGTKTDVAIEASSIVLMNDSLDKLPIAIQLSKKANRIIKQNLFISLGVVVVLVIGGIIGVTNVVVAVGVHEGSSLVVIFNALRLLYFKQTYRTQILVNNI